MYDIALMHMCLRRGLICRKTYAAPHSNNTFTKKESIDQHTLNFSTMDCRRIHVAPLITLNFTNNTAVSAMDLHRGIYYSSSLNPQ